jgi:phage shock protein C
VNTNYRQLQRNVSDRMIGGVCGGIGKYTGMDSTIVRLLAILLFFLTGPGMVVAYIIMTLIIPEEPARSAQ